MAYQPAPAAAHLAQNPCPLSHRPLAQVAGNPCLAYVQHIVLPWCEKFEVERAEQNGGNKCVVWARGAHSCGHGVVCMCVRVHGARGLLLQRSAAAAKGLLLLV